MKSPSAEKFERLVNAKSGILSKLRHGKLLNESSSSNSHQSHRHHKHSHPRPKHHHPHANPLNTSNSFPSTATPLPNASEPVPFAGDGTQYRTKFRGRLWNQKFIPGLTAALLLAEGFERLDLGAGLEMRSNGIVPPRLCTPLESYDCVCLVCLFDLFGLFGLFV
jgi:hypothetical protein